MSDELPSLLLEAGSAEEIRPRPRRIDDHGGTPLCPGPRLDGVDHLMPDSKSPQPGIDDEIDDGQPTTIVRANSGDRDDVAHEFTNELRFRRVACDVGLAPEKTRDCREIGRFGGSGVKSLAAHGTSKVVLLAE